MLKKHGQPFAGAIFTGEMREIEHIKKLRMLSEARPITQLTGGKFYFNFTK